MTKFSSFKEQQLLTEGWRTYMVEQQPISQPPQQQPPQQQQAQPQDKELQNFQQRQSAVTTVNKDIIAKKAIEYIKTLRGFDLEKNKQVVIDGLTMVIKQLQTPQQAQPVKESIYEGAHLDDGTLVCEACLEELLENQRTIIQEAKYQGRTVTLNKPMKGDVKKSKVYVKDPSTGNIKKVNFGDKNMTIKKDNPARRKSFRARHKCGQKKDKTSAGYWSCKAW